MSRAEWNMLDQRCTRIDETLQLWTQRLESLEEKVDALPLQICRLVEERQRETSSIMAVHQALQKAMQVFAEAMTPAPIRVQPDRPPATAERTPIPPPPPLHRSFSANKASLASIMTSPAQDSLPPSSPRPLPPPMALVEDAEEAPPPPPIEPTEPQTTFIKVEPIEHSQSVNSIIQSPQEHYATESTGIPASLPVEIPSVTQIRVESSVRLGTNPTTSTDDEDDSLKSPRLETHHSFLRPPRLAPSPVRNTTPSRRPISLTPDNLPVFTWSDGSERHAPEAWEFPSTNCKTMWRLWFHGDANHSIGPFRHLKSRDIERFAKDKTSRKQLSRARTVMNKLLEIALENSWIETVDELDGKSEDDLDAIFDQAFDVLLHHNPDGNLAGDGKLRADRATSYTYSSVHTFMVPTSRKRKHSTPEE
ncbi:hypothetical protein AC1031_018155 [Aphanomyces cochlioides]|nr:hypothetical protein AC1031_018155 [Aphanomyces cochlioides]